MTDSLVAWANGDASALDRLLPMVHAELRRVARRQMRRERPGHTLQTTALVHEAYLRLIDMNGVGWTDRVHFFALSARVMRRTLVDHARSHNRQKRGGGAVMVALDDLAVERSPDLEALDDALKDLARFDQRKSDIVELRYFGGVSVADVAVSLDVSESTVLRDWRLARAWLLKALEDRRHR